MSFYLLQAPPPGEDHRYLDHVVRDPHFLGYRRGVEGGQRFLELLHRFCRVHLRNVEIRKTSVSSGRLP